MRKGLILLLALICMVTLCSCSGGSDGGTATPQSYAGPGSRWQMALHNDGTFDTTELDSALEVSGTWIEKASGFNELTVTITNDSGAVALGSKGYGLEIPGVVFLLKPFDGDQIITMVESGTCPTGDITANWIMTNKNVDVTLNNGDGTGTGAEILNHDTGALSGSSVNVTINGSVDDPSDGFIYGTIDGADFVAMANVNVNGSGKNFIFVIGDNPGESGKLYNMLLISK